MSETLSPLEETVKPLTNRQLKALDLRVEGTSWDQISKQLDLTTRTLQTWRKHPEWDSTIQKRQDEWIQEYELRFSKMMPAVSKRHEQLVHSQSEAIAMRAVDSAHSNHVRCVREKETKTEVEELKAMVLMLTAELKQQRAG